MILSDVFAIALSILGFLLSLQGLWLVCRALWPGHVERASRRCERNPLGAFFVGVIVTAAAALIVGVASKAGAPGKMLAFTIFFIYVIFSGIGVSGLVTHIGRRLESPSDAARPWRATIRGGVALELAFLIPVLGWFGLLGMSLILGAGSATLALFAGGRRPATIAPELRVPPLPIDPMRRGLDLGVNSASAEQAALR